jgi:hypothetical protein
VANQKYDKWLLLDLANEDPAGIFAAIYHLKQTIHDYYKHGLETNHYEASRLVERLSKLLRDVPYVYPQFGHQFGRLAAALKDMALDLQVGPRRKMYYTMPRPLLGWS